MAKPKTQPWHALSIWPGDGASPEDFTSKVCGISSKGFNLAGTTSDTVVPDCDDPGAAAWVERVIRSLSAGISGSGLMAEETYPFWRSWMLSTEGKNVRIVLDGTTPGYYQGRFLLTRLDTTGNLGDAKVQISLSLESDGPIVWSSGAP